MILYIKSNKLSTRSYSAYSRKVVMRSDREISKFDPNWITGFVDGEGCFHVTITQRKDRKLGMGVQPQITIGLHEKEKALLEEIKNFFSVGKIYKHGPQTLQLRFESIIEIEEVIKHFNKYQLKTKKTSWLKIINNGCRKNET